MTDAICAAIAHDRERLSMSYYQLGKHYGLPTEEIRRLLKVAHSRYPTRPFSGSIVSVSGNAPVRTAMVPVQTASTARPSPISSMQRGPGS